VTFAEDIRDSEPITVGRGKMKTIAIVIASFCLATAAMADSCKDQAASKKLAGAALTSFMAKCTKDAQTSCDSQAAEKKLAGAAKTSFTKKCVSDATGT
jgi:hypothetical protein